MSFSSLLPFPLRLRFLWLDSIPWVHNLMFLSHTGSFLPYSRDVKTRAFKPRVGFLKILNLSLNKAQRFHSHPWGTPGSCSYTSHLQDACAFNWEHPHTMAVKKIVCYKCVKSWAAVTCWYRTFVFIICCPLRDRSIGSVHSWVKVKFLFGRKNSVCWNICFKGFFFLSRLSTAMAELTWTDSCVYMNMYV